METMTNGSSLPVRPEIAPAADIFNAKGVIVTLEQLMNRVTAEECTAATVNAACNCAARITDLLRIHLEVERLKRKRE
jgi:hypothetical protein